jgi:hypothetical protein
MDGSHVPVHRVAKAIWAPFVAAPAAMVALHRQDRV